MAIIKSSFTFVQTSKKETVPGVVLFNYGDKLWITFYSFFKLGSQLWERPQQVMNKKRKSICSGKPKELATITSNEKKITQNKITFTTELRKV